MITQQDITNRDNELISSDNVGRTNFREEFDFVLDEIIDSFNFILNRVIKSQELKESLECKIEKTYETYETPRACIKQDGSYCIKITIPFMRELCIYADLIASEYMGFWRRKFQLEASEQEIRNALFGCWGLIILCHEMAHIFNGHLDLLRHCNLISFATLVDVEYVEIIDANTDSEYVKCMKIQEHQDLWKAIESEADTYAAQAAMTILFQVDVIKSLLGKIHNIRDDGNLAYECIGHILMPLFYFYKIVSSKNDARHPSPFERAYISATSFQQFVKLKGGEEEDFRNILYVIVRSYYDVLDLLSIEINGDEVESAVKLMSNISIILNKYNIENFRKRK